MLQKFRYLSFYSCYDRKLTVKSLWRRCDNECSITLYSQHSTAPAVITFWSSCISLVETCCYHYLSERGGTQDPTNRKVFLYPCRRAYPTPASCTHPLVMVLHQSSSAKFVRTITDLFPTCNLFQFYIVLNRAGFYCCPSRSMQMSMDINSRNSFHLVPHQVSSLFKSIITFKFPL